MNDMTEPERLTREEWLANRRAEWEASGTDLSFNQWQAEKIMARQAEQDERDRQERKAELRRRRIANLQRQIPARYTEATTDEPALLRWVDELAELDQADDDTGPSLLIVGPTGTGKTHAAYGTVRRYVIQANGSRGVTCVTSADLYAACRPRPGHDTEAEFEKFARTRVLLLDDIGAAKGSEWTDEINYRLLNHRYNAKLPTIITSNVAPRELPSLVGERVASRLAEMCQTVVLKGDDRRRNRGAA